ncbi:MAG: hypothetical protein OCD02_21090 [Spirochaetaceae bacterium]
MKEFKINVFISEGCRLTQRSSEKLVTNAEDIFMNNGFNVSFKIDKTTYIEKILDNGISIFDFNMNKDLDDNDLVSDDPHIISVEKHKQLNLFPHNDTINLVLVKSLHDSGIDSWPHTATFKNTNTIFVSESCYESSLAHSLLNHFGVNDQYHDPNCLSYGSDCLRKDTLMSEDEKLILSEELTENLTTV